jgi:hypothetical protein
MVTTVMSEAVIADRDLHSNNNYRINQVKNDGDIAVTRGGQAR